jgi:hypothetical protein
MDSCILLENLRFFKCLGFTALKEAEGKIGGALMPPVIYRLPAGFL